MAGAEELQPRNDEIEFYKLKTQRLVKNTLKNTVIVRHTRL